MVYVILGMHKSGTTLVSQMLHRSGINMGWDLKDEDIYYDKQKCESPTVNNINLDLLQCRGIYSLELSPSKEIRFTPDLKKRMTNFIERQNSQFKDWGFKDPRTVLTYPVWKSLLPEHRLIIVFRHPYEVAHHYLNGLDTLWLRKYGYVRYKAYNVWKEYNKRALEIVESRDRTDYIKINYNLLMNGEGEIKRLSDFTGLNIRDMRNKKMYHARDGKPGKNIFKLWPQWIIDVDYTYQRLIK